MYLELCQMQYNFTSSCLPNVIQFAMIHKNEIFSIIDDYNLSWSFDDNVIAWLLPSLKKDIRKFYFDNEISMEDIFSEHQINHIDEDLLELIKEKVNFS